MMEVNYLNLFANLRFIWMIGYFYFFSNPKFSFHYFRFLVGI